MARITMKAQNIMLSGSGGAGQPPMDRGSDLVGDRDTTNPFHRANYIDRWREYVNWYYTSWMARKGVDIPVDDALRGGFDIKRIDPSVAKAMKARFDELNGLDKIDIASKQERLLGGCAIYIVAKDQKLSEVSKKNASDGLEVPLELTNIANNPKSIVSLNMVDINRISLPRSVNDIFDEEYDNPQKYWISGTEVDKSRLIVFDGKPLFGRTSYNILFPTPRVNPAGFGESILTTVYDDLIRCTGTAQGAFHLVNMASVMLVMMNDFTGLQSSKTGNAKLEKMREIVNSVNIYKGAILDGIGVDVKNLPASFGSVPELVNAFFHMLPAAWDIPATRFFGQSPSGLNATGQSDLENYYNMVQSFRERRLIPRIRQILKIIAIELYGIEQANNICNEMEVEFKPLWNLDTKTEAEAAKAWLDGMLPMLDRGYVSAEDFEKEAKKRNILLLPDTKVEIAKGEENIFSDHLAKLNGNDGKEVGKVEIPKEEK